jgi:hypothetical protein
MRHHVGYQYVNIDDCWMNAPANKDPLRVGPLRDAEGNMVPNKHFQSLPIRQWQRLGMGCGGRRAQLAHRGRPCSPGMAW